MNKNIDLSICTLESASYDPTSKSIEIIYSFKQKMKGAKLFRKASPDIEITKEVKDMILVSDIVEIEKVNPTLAYDICKNLSTDYQPLWYRRKLVKAKRDESLKKIEEEKTSELKKITDRIDELNNEISIVTVIEDSVNEHLIACSKKLEKAELEPKFHEVILTFGFIYLRHSKRQKEKILAEVRYYKDQLALAKADKDIASKEIGECLIKRDKTIDYFKKIEAEIDKNYYAELIKIK